jgi:hypothetical protein
VRRVYLALPEPLNVAFAIGALAGCARATRKIRRHINK